MKANVKRKLYIQDNHYNDNEYGNEIFLSNWMNNLKADTNEANAYNRMHKLPYRYNCKYRIQYHYSMASNNLTANIGTII